MKAIAIVQGHRAGTTDGWKTSLRTSHGGSATSIRGDGLSQRMEFPVKALPRPDRRPIRVSANRGDRKIGRCLGDQCAASKAASPIRRAEQLRIADVRSPNSSRAEAARYAVCGPSRCMRRAPRRPSIGPLNVG